MLTFLGVLTTQNLLDLVELFCEDNILIQSVECLWQSQLSNVFAKIIDSLIERRIEAKARGDKLASEVCKNSINRYDC